jgi:hypothetical protein
LDKGTSPLRALNTNSVALTIFPVGWIVSCSAGLCYILDLQRRCPLTCVPHVAHRSFMWFGLALNDRGMRLSNPKHCSSMLIGIVGSGDGIDLRPMTSRRYRKTCITHSDFGSAVSARKLLFQFDWFNTMPIGQHLSASKMSSPRNIYIENR